jgi:hypothetical protein
MNEQYITYESAEETINENDIEINSTMKKEEVEEDESFASFDDIIEFSLPGSSDEQHNYSQVAYEETVEDDIIAKSPQKVQKVSKTVETMTIERVPRKRDPIDYGEQKLTNMYCPSRDPNVLLILFCCSYRPVN